VLYLARASACVRNGHVCACISMPSGSGFLTGPEAQGKKHSLFYEKRVLVAGKICPCFQRISLG
jgi:hypothetical protein